MHPLTNCFLPLLVFALCGGSVQESGAHKPTYIWRDDATGDSLTCDLCAPGTYLLKHCTKDRKSDCGPCPKSHYTEIWNYIEQCQYCNRFCTADEIESVPCTQLHNRQCECKDGFYVIHGSCSRHRRCPPGQGVISKGTTHTDVKCEPCPGGFFSAKSSSSQTCQRFSVCAPGRTTLPGNDMNDVYCSACTNGSRTHEDEAICDGELMEFLALQILPPRKNRRLVAVLRRSAGKATTKNATVLDLLKTIKNKPSKHFAIQMLDILNTARLFHLRTKVNKWFPHMDL